MEIVTGVEYFSTVEASRKVIGTMAAVPRPTRQNPIMHIQKDGKSTEIAILATIRRALNVKVAFIHTHSPKPFVAKRANATQLMHVRYRRVKSSTYSSSLKETLLLSNIPPPQIEARTNGNPNKTSQGSGLHSIKLFRV